MRSHATLAAALPLAAFALLSPVRAHAQPDVVAITRRASPAVVTLHNFNAAGREVSLGSGFFLTDGRIATNRHVVEGASRITATSADDRPIGSVEYAEAVGRTADLAILPRVGNPTAKLPLATRLPEPGEGVVVIGAPEGLSNTVSTGIVSAIRRMNGRTLVQISAPISHGSSGGPVLNMRGEVIGVSVSVLSEGQNLNFAVPATELVSLSQQRADRISFTGNLRRGPADNGPGGPDVNTLPIARLPRIAVGQTTNGRLAESDFVRPDGSYADTYVYQGRAGERLTVTMRSSDFDSWLEVTDPRGPMNERDDDSAGGLDSELTVTLPHDGPFLIVANSVAAQATGGYSVSLRSAGRGQVDPNYGRGGTGTVTDLTRRQLPRITAGQPVSGSLTSADFVRSDDQTYADGYVYAGRAGERITVTMRSSAFDSYLVVDDPNGPMRESDDDSGGGSDAQVTVTLPHDGNYVVIANALLRGQTGPYTLSVRSGGRGPVDDGDSGGPGGGGGTLEDLARMRLPSLGAGQTVSGRLSSGDFRRSDDNTLADGYFYQGRAGEQLTITMRSNAFDAWLVFDDPNGPMRETDDDGAGGNDSRITVTLPHSGRYMIVANAVSPGATGPYTLSVQSGGGGGGVDDDDNDSGGGAGGSIEELAGTRLPRITAGQSVSGRLTSSDFLLDDNTYGDGYEYIGRAGERITITLRSDAFDSWLVIDDPNGPLREHDDDSGGGNDSRLTVTLPHSGRYVIVANSVGTRATGPYTLAVRSDR